MSKKAKEAKKAFQDSERQVRRDNRNNTKTKIDILTGKFVDYRTMTPPESQKQNQLARFNNKETWVSEMRGGKKRTNKMLKKRRRTNKRK